MPLQLYACQGIDYDRVMEPVTPSEGWGVLHLFCKVASGVDAAAIAAAVKSAGDAEDHTVIPVAILGHKADLAFLAIGPDLWRLRQLQTDLQAAGLTVVDSYVSLTELSEYSANVPDKQKQARLHPVLPPEGMTSFCFYPMSKRRNVDQNWFTLPYEQRLELMYEHGTSGRKFAGRIVQLVTGSTGIDDFEWGVTLFGKHPDDLKDCVYTMRFDQASAHYAEFGPFFTGLLGPLDELLARVGVS
ncbi:MAG: hydrogen peroxide-dependent heme synthase [Actinomycetota bacterium]|nr:hydrogen peroxide-dependent heme synthase [Actinomycetota bacterium]